MAAAVAIIPPLALVLLAWLGRLRPTGLPGSLLPGVLAGVAVVAALTGALVEPSLVVVLDWPRAAFGIGPALAVEPRLTPFVLLLVGLGVSPGLARAVGERDMRRVTYLAAAGVLMVTATNWPLLLLAWVVLDLGLSFADGQGSIKATALDVLGRYQTLTTQSAGLLCLALGAASASAAGAAVVGREPPSGGAVLWLTAAAVLRAHWRPVSASHRASEEWSGPALVSAICALVLVLRFTPLAESSALVALSLVVLAFHVGRAMEGGGGRLAHSVASHLVLTMLALAVDTPASRAAAYMLVLNLGLGAAIMLTADGLRGPQVPLRAPGVLRSLADRYLWRVEPVARTGRRWLSSWLGVRDSVDASAALRGVGGASLLGLPPSLGFAGRWLALRAALDADLAVVGLLVGVVTVADAVVWWPRLAGVAGSRTDDSERVTSGRALAAPLVAGLVVVLTGLRTSFLAGYAWDDAGSPFDWRSALAVITDLSALLAWLLVLGGVLLGAGLPKWTVARRVPPVAGAVLLVLTAYRRVGGRTMRRALSSLGAAVWHTESVLRGDTGHLLLIAIGLLLLLALV